MTCGPLDTAHIALHDALADGLVAAGFISSPELLERDPESSWEPDGEETEVQTACALYRLQTRPVRQLMGGSGPRWVVERDLRLELSATGPAPAGDPTHEERITALLLAAAAVPSDDPTLGQTCERLELTGLEDDDLPGRGVKKAITFTIRVRAGDPLGLTAP